MPDPISGYALSVIKDKFPLGDGVAVENSNRYSALSLAKVALAYGERSMNTHAVIYPYWELSLIHISSPTGRCRPWSTTFLNRGSIR